MRPIVTKTAVVMNDLQIPFQDNQVVYDLVLPFVRTLKPDVLLFNGDIADCYALSTHNKLRSDIRDIEGEVKECSRLFTAFAPHAKRRIMQGGNHEFRFDRILAARVPELGNAASFEATFRVREHGFEWVPYTGQSSNFQPGMTQLGSLTVTHGFLVRSHSAISAKAHFERLGASVMVGHTHRLGVYYKTNLSGVHGAWENGCLCLPNPEYTLFPDWQQGLSVVHYEEDGYFSVQQLPVIDRRIIQYGRERIEIKRKDRKR
jgi:predicted phosphodiesterase